MMSAVELAGFVAGAAMAAPIKIQNGAEDAAECQRASRTDQKYLQRPKHWLSNLSALGRIFLHE